MKERSPFGIRRGRGAISECAEKAVDPWGKSLEELAQNMSGMKCSYRAGTRL
jgi:hypothetical protein